MEIHSLKLSFTEQDLNGLAQRHLDDQPVEEVTFGLSEAGVQVKGVYPMFVNVKFETVWELAVQGGRLRARLADLRVLGMPAGIFKSAVLQFLAEAARKKDWLHIHSETLFFDVDRLLEKNGLAARTNLVRVLCQPGLLTFEAAGVVTG